MISSLDKVGQLKLASQVPSDFYWVLHHDYVGIKCRQHIKYKTTFSVTEVCSYQNLEVK